MCACIFINSTFYFYLFLRFSPHFGHSGLIETEQLKNKSIPKLKLFNTEISVCPRDNNPMFPKQVFQSFKPELLNTLAEYTNIFNCSCVHVQLEHQMYLMEQGTNQCFQLPTSLKEMFNRTIAL